MPSQEAQYTWTLSEELKKFAKKELNEDDKTRKQALETFRNWILKQPYVNKCHFDDRFLLRFLRIKKFSIPLAQEALLNYLATKMTFPKFYTKLDPLEAEIDSLLTRGFSFPLLERDALGRVVIIQTQKVCDPAADPWIAIKTAGLCIEVLSRREEIQICGIVMVFDDRETTPALLATFTPSILLNVTKASMKLFHGRLKVIHICNSHSLTTVACNLLKPLLADKLKTRLSLCKDTTDLQKIVPQHILPKEYGGKIPAKEMINAWKAELLRNRDWLLSLDEMSLDKKWQENRAKDLYDGVMGTQGSFRKLDID